MLVKPQDVTILQNIAESLKELVRLLMRPIWIQPDTGRLKVVVEAAAITVPTVTTVTNLNQMAGLDIRQSLFMATDRINFGNNIRARITI